MMIIDNAWRTPGLHLAERICGDTNVHFVLERYENGRYEVFVLLDDDPEGTLDAIFDAEQELYSVLPGAPFNVRVTKIDGHRWDSQSLIRSTAVRHERLTN